jgi:galactokinase
MSMPDTASADAPGRVNLIGEHTDYHQGYVLPTAIPQRTRVRLRRRDDRRVLAVSAGLVEPAEEYEAGRESPGRGWLDFVQGVTAMLLRRGVAVPGLDVHIASDVPVGAGVSSSAALTVALLRAMRTLLALDLDDVEVARVAQRVETEFVGAPVGIMDQMAASLGQEREALFIDTRSLAVERIPLPATLEIAVIDSGITHQHAGGEYAIRRRESFEAARLLGVEWLRDVDASDLSSLDGLPPLLARRARHVITENQRVVAAVAALRAGEATRLGALFSASHASMRDDYETSTPDIDRLVNIAEQREDVYGARLTGGGFGGAVVLVVRAGTATTASRQVCELYKRTTGRQPTVLVPPEFVPS